MKGIILAGGTGSRLFPATLACSKQLLNVYDKPMIYYSLSILLLLKIKDILIICTEKDLKSFKDLLKTGEQFGVKISYEVQYEPKGIADAFIVGEKFIGDDKVCLMLGDNFFYGENLQNTFDKAVTFTEGAVVFGYFVDNPKAFGVVEFDEDGRVVSIEEKPEKPKSNFAVPGLYFYDNEVVKIAKSIKPSNRGELEITSVNEEYLKKGKLQVTLFEKDVVWQDTGTHEDLLKASNFVRDTQREKKIYIGCLEEIAYKNGFISKEDLLKNIDRLKTTEYYKHIVKMLG